MKSLSYWAKLHPSNARIIIIISRILLGFLALGMSILFSAKGIEFSSRWLYLIIIAIFFTGMFYPGGKIGSSNYARRKTFDLIIAVLSFGLYFFTAGQLTQSFNFPSTASAAVVIKEPTYKNPEAGKLLNAFKTGEKTSFNKKEKRLIKQEFNYQVKRLLKAKITGNKADGNETLLIVLACIAAVGLLGLVAALACNLSCNGSDTAAIVVGLLGTAAIIWLLIITIKAIQRKSKKEKPDS